jgi:protein CpxP
MYKKIIGPVILACFLSAQPLLAHSSDCGQGLKEIVASLKLDDSQKEKIQPILEQLKSTIKDNAIQMDALDSQMEPAAISLLDDNSINSLVNKKITLIGNIMKAKMAAKKQIFTILNENQKSELQDKMKKMEEKMVEKYKDCHDND